MLQGVGFVSGTCLFLPSWKSAQMIRCCWGWAGKSSCTCSVETWIIVAKFPEYSIPTRPAPVWSEATDLEARTLCPVLPVTHVHTGPRQHGGRNYPIQLHRGQEPEEVDWNKESGRGREWELEERLGLAGQGDGDLGENEDWLGKEVGAIIWWGKLQLDGQGGGV